MTLEILCLPVLCATLSSTAVQETRFREVEARAGLDQVTYAHWFGGSAAADYDGDGWQDLVFFGSNQSGPRAFRNNGADLAQGASLPYFSEVTAQVFPPDSPPTDIGAFGDFDNDGDPDLLVARRYPSHKHPTGDREFTGLIAYENVGGTFVLAPTQAGLGRRPYQTGGLCLADLDLDSRLDVVFLQNFLGAPNQNYQGPTGWVIANQGFPNLVDQSAAYAGQIRTRRRYYSGLLLDFDNDFLTDFHGAVDVGLDVHAKNIGGEFREVSSRSNANNYGTDMGMSYGDIENDGDPDFHATNINTHLLYVNDGRGFFTKEGPQRGLLGFGVTGWGTAFVDTDHDGDQDLLYVGTGQPGHYFENDGKGYFTRYQSEVGVHLEGFSLTPFDFDRDGDMDLLISSLKSPPRLYENISAAARERSWLLVELEGTISNRDSVGAKIELAANGSRQYRWLVNGYSFKCNPPVEAHFGLKHATTVDLHVQWPSGKTITLNHVAVNQRLHLVEPNP